MTYLPFDNEFSFLYVRYQFSNKQMSFDIQAAHQISYDQKIKWLRVTIKTHYAPILDITQSWRF